MLQLITEAVADTVVSNSRREREVVMTADGQEPPTKKLAIAVPHGPATSARCGPLLLVLLGGVVTLRRGSNVVCVFCMLSDV